MLSDEDSLRDSAMADPSPSVAAAATIEELREPEIVTVSPSRVVNVRSKLELRVTDTAAAVDAAEGAASGAVHDEPCRSIRMTALPPDIGAALS